MTLSEFTIEYTLRHKEMPSKELIKSLSMYLDCTPEDKYRLHVYEGCFLKLRSEYRISPSFILPKDFIISVTEVFYNKEKGQVAFNFRFDVFGRPTSQHVDHHKFNAHPIDMLGSIFEIVNAKKCSALRAEIVSTTNGRNKYRYVPDKTSMI